MPISLVAVGAKITAALMNAVIGGVNQQGLTLVKPASVAGTGVSVSPAGKVTLAAATSASFNGIFTAAFTNYRIVIRIPTMAGASGTVTMVLRASGADNTTASYDSQILSGNGTSSTAATNLAGTSWNIVTAGSTNLVHTISMDIFGPALAAQQCAIVSSFSTANPMAVGNGYMQMRGNSTRFTTAFDGFSLAFGSAATGTISVYGYNAS